MRCNRCRKKTVIEYECKCSLKFCLECLPYYIHDCSFDYKKDKQNILIENNPKIVAVKVSTL